MRLTSDYYDKEAIFDQADLEFLLNIYIDWCKENGVEPEVDSIEQMETSVNAFDHVLYHAEIEIKKAFDEDTNLKSQYTPYTEVLDFFEIPQ